jgi:hypothetical protein
MLRSVGRYTWMILNSDLGNSGEVVGSRCLFEVITGTIPLKY